MQKTLSLFALAGMALLGAWAVGPTDAQESSGPAKSAHGAILAKTAHYQFEVYFYANGVRVFPADSAGAPVAVSQMNGKATFYYPKSTDSWFSRELRVGRGGASLDVPIGLKKVPASGVKVTIEVSGLPDPAESTATFTVPFEFYTAASIAEGAASTAPRYVYRPGYEGHGYYPSTGGATAPAPSNVYASPTSYGTSSGSYDSSHRDWTTGRDNLPLSKPWLRPLD